MYSGALCIQVKRFEFQIKTHFLVNDIFFGHNCSSTQEYLSSDNANNRSADPPEHLLFFFSKKVSYLNSLQWKFQFSS